MLINHPSKPFPLPGSLRQGCNGFNFMIVKVCLYVKSRLHNFVRISIFMSLVTSMPIFVFFHTSHFPVLALDRHQTTESVWGMARSILRQCVNSFALWTVRLCNDFSEESRQYQVMKHWMEGFWFHKLMTYTTEYARLL